MKKLTEICRAKSSGQLLIVAALAIALLVAATTAYVYELTGEKQDTKEGSLSDLVLTIKQNIRNAVISALANTSNGGDEKALAKNMEILSNAYLSLYQHEVCQLSYMLLNDSNYENGVWLLQGTDGLGVSSAYTSFTLKVFGLTSNITLKGVVNITTALTISGYYTANEAEKTVNLTLQVFNEGEPAKAEKIALYYENLGVWLPVNASNNLSIKDYGNGTYTASFTVATASDPPQISIHIHDLRNILVMANATCHQA